MKSTSASRIWTLHTHLSVLLVFTMLLTFSLVGTVLLVYGIASLERARQLELRQESTEISQRIALLLEGRQSRLALLGQMLQQTPVDAADRLLRRGLADGESMRAVYRVSPQGRLVALGLPEETRTPRQDLVGTDLSSNRLFQSVSEQHPIAWSGKFLSVVDGSFTAAVAVRDDQGFVMVGEVPPAALLDIVASATGERPFAIWVVDPAGEVVADTQGGHDVGSLNMHNWPLMQALRQGLPAPERLEFRGRTLHIATAQAPGLDWSIIAHAPAGLQNPAVRRMLLYVTGVFGASLLLGLLMAPFWAARMARPLLDIMARAERVTAGLAHGAPWPRGPVREFNSLAASLETMASRLQEREQKSQAIFNAAPVAMAVVSVHEHMRVRDVNKVWCHAFRRPREEVLGVCLEDLGLFPSDLQRDALLAGLQQGHASVETNFIRGDGDTLVAQAFSMKHIPLKSGDLGILAVVDLGPVRRVEKELRELNQQLEARVQQRTMALAASNAALSQTVEQLRAAQGELVQAEKMAGLGSLVAGVAHELHTPLGNGVMAVSAMADATRSFQAAMQAGVRRSDLLRFVENVQQGADIAARNLHRAVDLVQNFKQVAVDQTSAQRRSFELHEVVHEMVVSLRPSFSRTPYRIEVAVSETGLRMDSFPGALGQVIGNLIQNAVVHGFEGRDHGTVRIEAGRADASSIVLRVHDDGRGIAAGDIGRIFDPFMTTKMGRGGTGLGLHISYNAVTGLLGGSIRVHSVEGQGACFTLHLPDVAPRTGPDSDVHGAQARLRP